MSASILRWFLWPGVVACDTISTNMSSIFFNSGKRDQVTCCSFFHPSAANNASVASAGDSLPKNLVSTEGCCYKMRICFRSVTITSKCNPTIDSTNCLSGFAWSPVDTPGQVFLDIGTSSLLTKATDVIHWTAWVCQQITWHSVHFSFRCFENLDDDRPS